MIEARRTREYFRRTAHNVLQFNQPSLSDLNLLYRSRACGTMLPARLHRICTSSRMLHQVVHRQRVWRQAGMLACTFCTSAVKKQTNDPLQHLRENPYFSKYVDKLAKIQQTNPEEFKSRLEALEKEMKQREEERQKEIEEAKQSVEARSSQTRLETLSEYMKVDLIQDKSAEDIESIWKQYHEKKDVIHACIPAEEYEEIIKRSNEFSTFVYPLPRGAGYEFYLAFFNGNEIHFTPLHQFQKYAENAPTCLRVVHYTEFMKDKGIVLMVGEPDTKVLSVYEAQLLALQVKLYYGLHSGLKFNLVRQLNNSPDTFNYMDLVTEFENYKKDAEVASENKSN